MPYKDKAKRVEQVNRYRRNLKVRIVEAHGGFCFDCQESFPPYLFEFDHRVPSEKLFDVSKAKGFDRMYEESLKCDMVCPNCHRFRTHKRSCTGCDWC